MVEKVKYEKAEADVVMFGNSDPVVVTSLCGGPCTHGNGSSRSWGDISGC